MPIYTLLREEGLVGRFQDIWDPSPSGVGISAVLQKACPGTHLHISAGEHWAKHLQPLPAPAILSSPPRRELTNLALSLITAGAEYIAFFADAAALGGLERWERLYSLYPPSRVYWLAESWTAVSMDRAGRSGAWRPACWIVWDGDGQPIKNWPRPPGFTSLRWIPDSSRL